MTTLKLSPVHPKKPKIVAMPMKHLNYHNFPYLYICRDQHGWFCTFSLYTAVAFYTNPYDYRGQRTQHLDKAIAMRLAVSNIMRTGKGN